MKHFRSLALILGSKPPGKGGVAPKDVKRPGLKDQYADEVKDALEAKDGKALAQAIEGLVTATIAEEK